MTTAVKIENLTKIYGSRSATDKAKKMLEAGKSKEDIVKQTGATVGVHNANIEINQGETFVIMGLSGSGKSTMLRMINRLIEPTAGKISIFGEPVTGTSKEKLRQIRREKVSMVFQNFALFPHKTILENTEFGLEIQGVGKAERQKAAEKALENSGLLTFKDQYPNQLSGGMQQRVGLA
ncbi:MAG: glycine betaine/L-proline ABC transporter ATP-binding protein, partial [Aerococcus viridans]